MRDHRGGGRSPGGFLPRWTLLCGAAVICVMAVALLVNVKVLSSRGANSEGDVQQKMMKTLEHLTVKLSEMEMQLQQLDRTMRARTGGAPEHAEDVSSLCRKAAASSQRAATSCALVEISQSNSGVDPSTLSASADPRSSGSSESVDTASVMEGQSADRVAKYRSLNLGTQGARRAALLAKMAKHESMQRDMRSGKIPGRYLHCKLLNGWGNVLQEAVSCILLALATERALVLDYRPVQGYMPFAKFVVPPEPALQDCFNTNLAAQLEKDNQLIVPRHNFSWIDWDKDLKHANNIQVHLTYDYWANNMIVNPIHGDTVITWLPRNFYQMMFNWLFKLAPDIQRDVDAFKAKYFSPYTIGLQIRSASSTSMGGKTDHKGFPVAPIRIYAQTAHNLENWQDVIPASDVKWFVATQDLELIDYLREAYGDKILAVNATIMTTFDAHEEGQRAALMTWWLLGETDDVLTSESSSYGTTAAARGGTTPIVCNHFKYCARRLTPTPCQDTKFLVEQPQEGLAAVSTMPHHFVSSPESSCGYWKHATYMSKEYRDANKK